MRLYAEGGVRDGQCQQRDVLHLWDSRQEWVGMGSLRKTMRAAGIAEANQPCADLS